MNKDDENVEKLATLLPGIASKHTNAITRDIMNIYKCPETNEFKCTYHQVLTATLSAASYISAALIKWMHNLTDKPLPIPEDLTQYLGEIIKLRLELGTIKIEEPHP